MDVERFARRARREWSVDRANLLKYDNSKIERLLQPTKDEGGTSFRNFVDINRRRSIDAEIGKSKLVQQRIREWLYSCMYVYVWHAVVRSYAGDAREVGSRLGNPLSRDRSSKSV